MDMEEVTSKVCTKCGVDKPFSEFYKQKNGKHGLRAACKICTNKSNKKWYDDNTEKVQKYRDNRKEERNEKQKTYYRENCEERKAYSRQYTLDNKEKISEYKKEYYKENITSIKEARHKYYTANSESICADKKRYREENKEVISAKRKVYYAKNRDKLIQYHRDYYYQNRPKLLAQAKEYRDRNRDRLSYNRAAYRAAILEATPEWLTDNDFKKIRDFYKESARLTKETGIEHHVDHIYPLRPKGCIGGAHEPNNLQILSCNENQSKNNKVTEPPKGMRYEVVMCNGQEKMTTVRIND